MNKSGNPLRFRAQKRPVPRREEVQTSLELKSFPPPMIGGDARWRSEVPWQGHFLTPTTHACNIKSEPSSSESTFAAWFERCPYRNRETFESTSRVQGRVFTVSRDIDVLQNDVPVFQSWWRAKRRKIVIGRSAVKLNRWRSQYTLSHLRRSSTCHFPIWSFSVALKLKKYNRISSSEKCRFVASFRTTTFRTLKFEPNTRQQ